MCFARSKFLETVSKTFYRFGFVVIERKFNEANFAELQENGLLATCSKA